MPKPPARARIRTAALELMARKGVSGATTQDIAGRAGCSQAVLYKHWPGKEGLAREIFEGAQAAMLEAMTRGAAGVPDPGERPIGALLGLLRFAREEPRAFAFLFQVFHGEYARWLGGHRMPRDVLLEELKRSGAGGDPALKAALLLGMTVRLAFFERQNLVGGDPARREEALWRAAAAVLES